MATRQKNQRILAGQRLWVLPAACSFLSLIWVAPTIAVETAPPTATSFLISQATQTKPAASRPRPKPAFFEEERRPRFGFGDFLNSALDGADNSFSSDSVQQSPITLEPLSVVVVTTGIDGILTVGINENRRTTSDMRNTPVTPEPPSVVVTPRIDGPLPGGNENPGPISPGGSVFVSDAPVVRTASGINDNRTTSDPINNPAFLNGSFISKDGTNLQFSNVISGSNPQRGTLTVEGTIFINGVPNPVIGVREYSASGNENNGFVSVTVQLVDPKNPSQAILIQVPASRNSGDRNTARGRANLSIGRPIDR